MATEQEQVPHSVSSGCGVERTLAVLRDHWSLLILRDLIDGPMRFNALKRSLDGVSSKVLSERLDELREAGVVEKKVFADVPVRVVYSLTEKGEDLRRVIEDIRAWGEKWIPVANHEVR